MHAVSVRSVMCFVISPPVVNTIINRCQYHYRYGKNADENRKTDNKTQQTIRADCFHGQERDNCCNRQYEYNE